MVFTTVLVIERKSFHAKSLQKILTEIGRISAFDMDEGLNGQVSYDLRCSNELFMVEPSSGRIFSVTDLKEYLNDTADCKAFASDQGYPAMTSDVSHS